MHVSIKRAHRAPSLRAERVFTAIVGEIASAARRGVQVIHYSVQDDHVHLLVEADDGLKLARGMQLLFSRMAFAVNRIARRHGSLFLDRHHRHELATPTEVRRALVYVIFNSRKHGATRARRMEWQADWLDECSSGLWFDDWDPRARPPPGMVTRKRERAGPSPLCAPQTWLARIGWHRGGGLLRFDETPSLNRR